MPIWLPPEHSEHAPANRRGRHSVLMHSDDHWMDVNWYELPREDPNLPEVHTYTNAMSYAPGDEVRFHVSCPAPSWSLEVYRDGAKPHLVHSADDLRASFVPAPEAAYKSGCGWPVRHVWRIPADTRSGFYRIVSVCHRPDGSRFLQHHFLVVRPTPETRSGPLLMVLPTATWTAYNGWGGANHYEGIEGPNGQEPSPVLSLQRPWARGFVWLPEGAPRICEPPPEPGAAPRYPVRDWSYANGFAQYSSSAGWAQFDRHFVRWAEREGYKLDIITQTDLESHADLLSNYCCLVVVGHDEYWSAPMRSAVDAFVSDGGGVARFAGNFLWQIRLEQGGDRQVCYKFRAPEQDPVRGTDKARLLTTLWEAPEVNWPGAATFGVNGMEGLYAGWGGFTPRGQRGFTVYRPKHWIFGDTGLSYADIFGDEARIFGYEVDGLDYTFIDGLPYPTGRDGAATDIEILAMAPAVLAEAQQQGPGVRMYIADSDLRALVRLMTGSEDEVALARYRYGSGMVVAMRKGRGEVITAGSCEWVMGLTRNDPTTQQITRNILNRFVSLQSRRTLRHRRTRGSERPAD